MHFLILIYFIIGASFENEAALHEALKYSPLFWFVPKLLSRSLVGRLTNWVFSETPDIPNKAPPRSAGQERLAKYGRRAAAIILIVVMTSLIFHNGNPSLPDAIKFDYARLAPFLHISRVYQVSFIFILFVLLYLFYFIILFYLLYFIY